MQAVLLRVLLCVSHHVVLPLHHHLPHQCPVLLVPPGVWDLPALLDVVEHPALWEVWDPWGPWDLLEPRASLAWPHLLNSVLLFAYVGQQLSSQVEECLRFLPFRPRRALLNVSRLVAALLLRLRLL